MTGGNSPICYLKAYHTNLYLSSDAEKVSGAIEEGESGVQLGGRTAGGSPQGVDPMEDFQFPHPMHLRFALPHTSDAPKSFQFP